MRGTERRFRLRYALSVLAVSSDAGCNLSPGARALETRPRRFPPSAHALGDDVS